MRIIPGESMKYEFPSYEIAEKAMSIEEEGAKFYRGLSNATDNHVLKDIFNALSKAEIEHRKRFSEIAADHLTDDKAEYSIDISTLIQNHLNDLKEYAFKAKSSVQTIQDALKIAINLEETAIWIYRTMQASFSRSVHDILEEIINEENKHLEILTEIKGKQKRGKM